MTRFRKEYIEMHSDGPYRVANPAINVKVRRWPLTIDTVVEKFGCSEDDAEKALGFVFESNQELFWDEAKWLAEEIFGKSAKVYSEGYSSGWLVVHGLSEVHGWDAIMVSKWGYFVRQIESAMKGYLDSSRWLEDIESNRWWETGAEQYNFIETKEGKNACLVDVLKVEREARAAYFASL
jgi:hypothetical protein